MADKKKVILCIAEGAKTERNILNPLFRQYLSDESIEIYHFGASIYELYKALSEDEDLETYRVLAERVHNWNKEKLPYKRNQILGIYLFFDFEGHAKHAQDIHHNMLQLFDNESENGKLLFSYPMVEAYKHPIEKSNIVPIEAGYKRYVAEQCDKKLEQLGKFNKSQWNELLKTHLININEFLYQTQELPEQYSEDDFTQELILNEQQKNHIPNNNLRVISPFVLFLLDNLGNEMLNEWKKSMNNSTTIPLGTYRHFKGNDYNVIGTVKHSETEETLVLYHTLYGSEEEQAQLWVRPIDMFLGTKEVDGKHVQRFDFI